MIDIYGIYFICCINNYLEVVEEQLDIVNKGLLERTEKIILFITKYDETCGKLDILLQKYNTDKFILVKSSDNLYEKFAINNYKVYINDYINDRKNDNNGNGNDNNNNNNNNNNDYYVYYFHTKGVSHFYNWPYWYHVCSSVRKILNFYTLEKFDINIKLLEEYDAVGCSLSSLPKKHFSGNFWWSKSQYVNLLGNINDKYLSPEMYILSNETCKYVSLANDTNIIPFQYYTFRNSNDILQNITREFIPINNNTEKENLLAYLDQC